MTPKHRVAAHAAKLVKQDMVVGLGTGSTANLFIEALAKRQQAEQLSITTVCSSAISASMANQAGLKVASIESINYLDLYVDGADEVSPGLNLLKGRGQDLVKEKLLASAANQFYVMIDNSKQVDYIGQNFPIPVEVMPEAWQLVLSQLTYHVGGTGSLRLNAGGDNYAITAEGNLVLDMQMEYQSVLDLTMVLDTIPGIVEHGIFTELATAVFVGGEQSVEELWAATIE